MKRSDAPAQTPPLVTTPYDPATPLRADATDDEMDERLFVLIRRNTHSDLARDAFDLAREYATACVAAARVSAPVVTREQVETVQLAAGLIQTLSDALVALGDSFRHPYPQPARDIERYTIAALRELGDVLALFDAPDAATEPTP